MPRTMAFAERVEMMRARDERHERLWRRLLADRPELGAGEMSDWAFVNLLRGWAFANIRRQAWVTGDTMSHYLDQDTEFGFYGRDAPDLFEAFAADRGGVIGGGCCWSMYTLYDAFGFTAAIVDTGERGGYSRIGVICEIYHDGDFIWVTQDPNYDFALADADGEPISYFRALAYLARRQDDRIRLLTGDDEAYRLTIVHPQQLDRLDSDWTIRPETQPERILEDGRRVYRAHMSWASFQKAADPRPFDVVRRAGLPERLIYFFMMPFGIYPASLPQRAMLWERITNALPAIGPLAD